LFASIDPSENKPGPYALGPGARFLEKWGLKVLADRVVNQYDGHEMAD
jgi:hypothetical protein